MAEKVARTYARDHYHNPYGQKVTTNYLGYVDAFELFDEPGPNVEVFSTTDVTTDCLSKRELLRQRLGKEDEMPESKRRKLRTKFLNREFGQMDAFMQNEPITPKKK